MARSMVRAHPNSVGPSGNLNVRSGSRLCENSDVELARRNSVSITLNRKTIALADTVERRKGRKQFCAFSARARFHTAWVINGPGGPEIPLPLFPRKRTQVGHPAMSVWCQHATSGR